MNGIIREDETETDLMAWQVYHFSRQLHPNDSTRHHPRSILWLSFFGWCIVCNSLSDFRYLGEGRQRWTVPSSQHKSNVAPPKAVEWYRCQSRVCMRRNSFISFNGSNKCIDSYLLTQEPRIRVLTPKRNIFISVFDFDSNPTPYTSCCRIYSLQFFQA